MNWSDSTQLWVLVLFVTAAITVAGYSIYYVCKKRSVDEEPLPQCNLQERLSQIAKTSLPALKKPA
jgi:Tfp pilus assembly protein PilO